MHWRRRSLWLVCWFRNGLLVPIVYLGSEFCSLLKKDFAHIFNGKCFVPLPGTDHIQGVAFNEWSDFSKQTFHIACILISIWSVKVNIVFYCSLTPNPNCGILGSSGRPYATRIWSENEHVEMRVNKLAESSRQRWWQDQLNNPTEWRSSVTHRHSPYPSSTRHPAQSSWRWRFLSPGQGWERWQTEMYPLPTRAHFFEYAQCSGHHQPLRVHLMFGNGSKFFRAKFSNKMDSCAKEYSTWDQKQCIAIKTKALYGLQMDSSGNSKMRIQVRLEQWQPQWNEYVVSQEEIMKASVEAWKWAYLPNNWTTHKHENYGCWVKAGNLRLGHTLLYTLGTWVLENLFLSCNRQHLFTALTGMS